MRKYYLGIVFLIVLFAVPLHAHACSYTEKVRLKKLASNVNFSYRYTEVEDTVSFQITVSNLTSDIYMVDTSTGQAYYSNNEDFVISGYHSGQQVKFSFYAKDSNCLEGTILNNYVTLPTYNIYYKEAICNGVEDYKLCQKWLKHNMSYSEFYDGVYQYRNKVTEKEKELEKQKEKQTINYEKIIDIWSKYYVFILGAIIIIGGIILYRYDKKTDL